MPTTVPCASCSKPVIAPDHLLNSALLCPHCRQPLTLPSAEVIEAEPIEDEVIEAAPVEDDAPVAEPVPTSENVFEEVVSAHEDPDLPKYPADDWETTRSGLNFVAFGTIGVVIAQAAQFVAEIAGTFLGAGAGLSPDLLEVILFLTATVNVCGALAGLAGVWMTQSVPRRSGLRGRGVNAAFALTSVPVCLVALSAAIAFNARPMYVLGLIAFLGLTVIVGAVLYLLFLSDMSGHFGDRALAGEFTGLLTMLVIFWIVVPILFAIGGFVVVATLPVRAVGESFSFDPAAIRQSRAIQGISIAVFLASIILQLRFFEMTGRLKRRLEAVVG